MTDPHPARALWHALEPLHAVTYFAPEAIDAAKATGLRGFWMVYFGCRAAPMGPVAPGVIEATFANFAPHMVRRAIPDAWSHAAPEVLVEVRARAAAEVLRGIIDGIDGVADRVNPTLDRIIAAADGLGRPLFAANREIASFDDPVVDLWQRCTTLREHRGDGHVACLARAGIGGCETHIVMAAANDVPGRVFQESRGWTDDDWRTAIDRLEARGLLSGGALTDLGRAVHGEIEARTDELAAVPLTDSLTVEEVAELIAELAGPAEAAASVLRFPNPMGLPEPSA